VKKYAKKYAYKYVKYAKYAVKYAIQYAKKYAKKYVIKYAEYVIKYAKYVISIEYDMCSQKYAKYAIKYAEYAKYVILKKICRICTPHFADADPGHAGLRRYCESPVTGPGEFHRSRPGPPRPSREEPGPGPSASLGLGPQAHDDGHGPIRVSPILEEGVWFVASTGLWRHCGQSSSESDWQSLGCQNILVHIIIVKKY
jgi:hypothetical protein